MNTKPAMLLRDRTYGRSLNIILMILLCAHLPSWGQQTNINKEKLAANTEEKEKAIILRPFSVTAEADASGYGVTSATSFSRLNIPLRDIPQAINIVTDHFMRELAAPNLGEAVAFLPGVSTRVGSPDRFQFRSIDVSSQFQNGFRFMFAAPGGGSLDFEKDTVNIDRIEVIKGLGSATTGRGEAGGVINLITKKPQTKKMSSVALLVDQYGYNKTELDTTGPLNASGSVLYRTIASYTGGETFQANEKYKRFSFFPSLEFRFNDRTNLLIEGSLQTGQSPSSANFAEADLRPLFYRDSTGAPKVLAAPREVELLLTFLPRSFSQSLSFIKPDAQIYQVVSQFSHKFTDWLSIREGVALFKAQVDRDQTRTRDFVNWVFAPNNLTGSPIDWLTRVNRQLNETDTEFASNQGDIVLDFEFAKTTNQTLIGYEYTMRDTFARQSSAFGRFAVPMLDRTIISNLQAGDILPMAVTAWDKKESTETGAYIQHTMKMWNDRILLTGARRYDGIETDIENYRTNIKTQERPASTDATYRFGGSFRPFPWLTVYAMHAEQLDPQTFVFRFPRGNNGITSRDVNQQISAARAVELNEFGIKSELYAGKLTFNATYYDIGEANNIRGVDFQTNTQDRTSPLYNWYENVVDPTSTANGVELELMGAPTERLSFYASAAFAKSELNAAQADGSIFQQKRRGHSPTRLSFAGNVLVGKSHGWTCYAQTALGYTDVVTSNPGTRGILQASLRWDLGVRLLRREDRSGWEMQARVQNVLDQIITTGTAGSGTGARRLTLYLKRSF